MGQYYYTLSSLPYLKAGDKSPLSWDEFLAACADFIPLRLLKQLMACQSSDAEAIKSAHPFLKKWKSQEAEINRYIAIIRAKRMEWEQTTELTYETPIPEEAIKQALQKENPLDVEHALDEIKFDALEDSLLGHYFDEQALIVYALKLLLLLRYEKFDREMGGQKFDNTYNKIVENINSNNSTLGETA